MSGGLHGLNVVETGFAEVVYGARYLRKEAVVAGPFVADINVDGNVACLLDEGLPLLSGG